MNFAHKLKIFDQKLTPYFMSTAFWQPLFTFCPCDRQLRHSGQKSSEQSQSHFDLFVQEELRETCTQPISFFSQQSFI